jgi:hypothetical protein
MAHTTADLDAIKSAIASGEQSVEVAGRKVVYRSVDDLRKARDDIAAELTGQASTLTSAVRRGSYAVRFATSRE